MNTIFRYPDTSTIEYRTQLPFPHALITGSWDEIALSKCAQEVDQFSDWDGEKCFYGSERKRYCSNWSNLPPTVSELISEASKPKFLHWLEDLTNERCLMADPYLRGGGIHSIRRGGFLKVHADFNWHEDLQIYRRINLLLYLNIEWKPSWKGDLELWGRDLKHCSKRIQPLFNTMVVFTTDDKSFHGHPHPLQSPENVTRNSLALYYYSAKKPRKNYSFPRIVTDYRPTSGELFRVDSWIKRYLSNSKFVKQLRYLIRKKYKAE